MPRARLLPLLVVAVVLALAAPARAQTGCPVKLGGGVRGHGPLGAVGKPIADTARIAVEHRQRGRRRQRLPDRVHPARRPGPADGRRRRRQAPGRRRGRAGADRRVSTGVSLPILTSVAVPGKVTKVTCCSTSPTFTTLAAERPDRGLLVPHLRHQDPGYAWVPGRHRAGLQAHRGDLRQHRFRGHHGRAVRAGLREARRLGGGALPYNESQPSYRAEVNRRSRRSPIPSICSLSPRMAPRSPASGSRSAAPATSSSTTRCANGVSQGGRRAASTRSATAWTPPRSPGHSADGFNEAFQGSSAARPTGPASTPCSMRSPWCSSRWRRRRDHRHLDPGQHPPGDLAGRHEVSTGVEDKKARDHLLAGQAVRYVGATGPVPFDE